MRAHHQVRVPVPPGIVAVRADSPDLRGEVDDELGPRRFEEARGVAGARQVIVASSCNERLQALPPHAFDEVRTEETAAPGDQHAHRPRVASGTDESRKPKHSPNT